MKTESRLKLLVRAVNKWVDLPGKTRAIVCQEIVEALEVSGMKETLEAEGITFNTGGDLLNQMRVNAQKLFRWLGCYDEVHAFPDRLFYVEPLILAAMPEDIKIHYLNSVYGPSGVTVCRLSIGEASDEFDLLKMVREITKENADAQVCLIDHSCSQSKETAKRAHEELSEALAIGTVVLRRLEDELTES